MPRIAAASEINTDCWAMRSAGEARGVPARSRRKKSVMDRTVAPATGRLYPPGIRFPPFLDTSPLRLQSAPPGSTHERLDDGLPADAVGDLPAGRSIVRASGDRLAQSRQVAAS